MRTAKNNNLILDFDSVWVEKIEVVSSKIINRNTHAAVSIVAAKP
jgi:hypothetical protein